MNNTTQQPTETPKALGIEALVCADIAQRQQKGIAKYGVQVADNPLTQSQWIQHAYEEALDLSVYLRKIIEMERNQNAK